MPRLTIWDYFWRTDPPPELSSKGWRASMPAPESQGELGEEARKLLDNPVLIEALDRIERKLVGSWQNSAVGDEEAREAAYRLHWAAEQFRAELRVMIANAGLIARQRAE